MDRAAEEISSDGPLVGDDLEAAKAWAANGRFLRCDHAMSTGRGVQDPGDSAGTSPEPNGAGHLRVIKAQP